MEPLIKFVTLCRGSSNPECLEMVRSTCSWEMGDATKVAVVAVGVIHLSFGSDRILVLNNCLVPSFRRNLISVSKLALDGYNFVWIVMFLL